MKTSMGFLLAAVSLLAGGQPTKALDGKEQGAVGWEVRSTNTPGGGGELTSRGVHGEATPWYVVRVAPTVAGTAVTNLVIVYYRTKEDRDAAIAEDKRRREEARKKREEDRRRRAEERRRRAEDRKKKASTGKPATFSDHAYCETPLRFDGSGHFDWWLRTHEHRSAPSVASPSSDGMKLYLTGSVVEGQLASARVVDARGAFLEGVVVSLGEGKSARTDGNGRVAFQVPRGAQTLLVGLAGTAVVARAWVREARSTAPETPRLDPPGPIQPGQPAEIGWSGGRPGDQIRIDEVPAEVLAASPTGCVIVAPSDLAPGAHAVHLERDGQVVDTMVLPVVGLQVEPPKRLVVGQGAAYEVRVRGTEDPVALTVTNLSPQTVSLQGEAMLGALTTSGGGDNRVRVGIRAVSQGGIRIAVAAAPVSFGDWNRLAQEVADSSEGRAASARERGEAAAREANLADYFGTSRDADGARWRKAAAAWKAAAKRWRDAVRAWERGEDASAIEEDAERLEEEARDAATSR